MSFAVSSSATSRGLAARGIKPVADPEADHPRPRSEVSELLEEQRYTEARDLAIQRWLATTHALDRPGLTIGKIVRRFSGVYGVTIKDIKGPSKQRDIVLVRMAVMYWVRRRLGASYPEIGHRLSKDHTSILHGVRVYPARRARMGVTLRPLVETPE